MVIVVVVLIPPDLAKIINLMFNYNIDDVKSIISQFFMYGSNSNDDIDSSSNQTLLQSSFCEDCVIFRSSHYDTNGYITPYKRSYQPDALSNNNNDNNNDGSSSSSSSSSSNGLHCADTLSISTESMELLAQNPPQGLFESYYSCKNTWLTNLYYAVGIAFGNMQVFSVLLFIIILPICYSCTIYFGITKKNELIQRKLSKKQKSLFLTSSKSSSSNSSSRRRYGYRGIVDDIFNQYPHRKSSFQDMNPGLRHGINLIEKSPDDDDDEDNDDDGDGNGGSDDDENGNNNDDDDNDKGNDIEFDFDDTNNNNHVMNI